MRRVRFPSAAQMKPLGIYLEGFLHLRARHGAGVVGFGVGIGGHVDRDRRIVHPSPGLHWPETDLSAKLRTTFGVPVVENDANRIHRCGRRIRSPGDRSGGPPGAHAVGADVWRPSSVLLGAQRPDHGDAGPRPGAGWVAIPGVFGSG